MINKQMTMAFLTGCAAVCFFVLLVLIGDKTNPVELSPEMQRALEKADRDFSFGGKPIHPELIKEFETWFSDKSSPVTVSVDVAAAVHAHNEYDTDVVAIENNRVRATNSDGRGFYEYERIGTLKNGLHILRTYDCGGGSGVFQNLFFVRFSPDVAYGGDGQSYERLLMTVVGEFPLGDRDNSRIEISLNKVIISPSKYRSKPTVLEFE